MKKILLLIMVMFCFTIAQTTVQAGPPTKKIITVDYTRGNEQMNKLLILGVNKNDLDMIQTALDNGANVNIFDSFNHTDTPLSIAVAHKNIILVDFLLEKGADPNALIKTYSAGYPVTIAMKHFYCGEAIIVKLIDAGLNIKYLDIDNQNILFNIIVSKSYDNLDNFYSYLISKGVNINQINSKNETLLIFAFQHNLNQSKILQLIELGINTKIIDNSGRRAIDYAISRGDKDIIRRLMEIN